MSMSPRSSWRRCAALSATWRVGPQPAVAVVGGAVGAGADMGLDRFAVEDEALPAGEDVEEEARRPGLGHRHLQRVLVDRADLLLGLLLRQPPLRVLGGVAEAEIQHAADAPLGVLRRDRVARGVPQAATEMEGVGPAVLADLPAFGEPRLQPRRIIDILEDQRIAGVVDDLVSDDLADLGRVHRQDPVDVPGHHQRVARGARLRLRRRAGHGERRRCGHKDRSRSAHHVPPPSRDRGPRSSLPRGLRHSFAPRRKPFLRARRARRRGRDDPAARPHGIAGPRVPLAPAVERRSVGGLTADRATG
jgi:hypothetical protein